MGQKSGNWYERKRKNKRAITNKERRNQRLATREVHATTGVSGNIGITTGPEIRAEDGRLGVIAEVQKSYYIVMCGDTPVHCTIKDAVFPAGMESLVIGDRVVCTLMDNGTGVVRQIFPRVTKLARKREDRTRRGGYEEHVLAANIDIAVVVASAVSPPFRPRLVDRYLIMCQDGNVPAAICINKCDLITEPPDLSIYNDLGIPTVFVSAATGYGLNELKALLHGKYSVLTGHSGVGKSTIINALLGKDILRVGEVGGKRGMGRHTTSVSTLHKLDDTSYLVDTPGIRGLGLWEIDKRELGFYFPEFRDYLPFCKFKDCLHMQEPDCAVREAVSNNKVPRVRYTSYLRMMAELLK